MSSTLGYDIKLLEDLLWELVGFGTLVGEAERLETPIANYVLEDLTSLAWRAIPKEWDAEIFVVALELVLAGVLAASQVPVSARGKETGSA